MSTDDWLGQFSRAESLGEEARKAGAPTIAGEAARKAEEARRQLIVAQALAQVDAQREGRPVPAIELPEEPAKPRRESSAARRWFVDELRAGYVQNDMGDLEPTGMCNAHVLATARRIAWAEIEEAQT